MKGININGGAGVPTTGVQALLEIPVEKKSHAGSRHLQRRSNPFGGGWHLWRVGQKSFEVMPRIRKPIADANLTICGEAWSIDQGWVEGALSTAERVLQDHFGLERPDWLSADVELGP